MRTWLAHFWGRISASLWFMPVLMSLGAVALLLTTWLIGDEAVEAVVSHGYFYPGDVESARRVLATIAGSIINVAGVSFSVTMVALSLTSSQLGPHLLVNFMRDRGNQVVLGGFLATFLYCLLALGSTTTESEATATVMASTALVLAGLSLVLLIYFIHHIATSMQADHVINEVAEVARRSLDRLFPNPAESLEPESAVSWTSLPGRIPSPGTGYIQALDQARLVRLASRHDLHLKVLHRPGHYVIEGAPLIAVSVDPLPDAALAGGIQRAFIIGSRRTAEQDPEYAIHQLVEVAVRALSPGINDPFTAITCVDHLTGIYCGVGPRPMRPTLQRDDRGVARVELDRTDFTGLLDAGFHQIRQFARDVPAVTMRLLEGLAAIAGTINDPDRRATVARHGRLVMAAQEGRHLPDDQQALEERFQAIQSALEAPSRHAPRHTCS
jgi:uncharacterized membrane protein